MNEFDVEARYTYWATWLAEHDPIEVVALLMAAELLTASGAKTDLRVEAEERVAKPFRDLLGHPLAWEALGLRFGESVSPDVLKAAYRERAKKVHPDQGGNPREFRRVHRAYTHLMGIIARRAA
jgi:hypothetical protein